MRELLIVGVDPGTTVGYAILDIRGNVLRVKSSKQLDLNTLLEEIVHVGTAMLIGTDKKKCPALIEKVAATTGAMIVVPEEDLLVSEKEELTREHIVRIGHEKDALAAALYAYREIEPLLRRIERAVETEGKIAIMREVMRNVVLNGRNIQDAIRDEDRPLNLPASSVKAALPEKTAQETFQELQLKMLVKENTFLKKYNAKLLATLKKANGELTRHLKAAGQAVAAMPAAKHDDTLIPQLRRIISQKESELSSLRAERQKLHDILTSGAAIAKKTSKLGIGEVQQLNDNDIILVEHPEIFSEKALDHMRQKNASILTRSPLPGAAARTLANFGLTAIPAAGLIILESDKFAAVDGAKLAALRKAAAGRNMYGIIESYKEERKTLQ